MTPIRFSNLKHVAQSLAHYEFHAAQPYTRSKKPEFLIGSAAHKMVLGAGQDIAVFTGKVRRGKEWDAFEAANADKIILNEREYERAERISKRTLANARVQELLARAPHREKTLTWQLNGKDCIGTPDAFGDDIIIEIKTCRTAHPDKFGWQAKAYSYHAQLDWYRNAVELTDHYSGRPRDAFIISIETSEVAPPPVVRPLTEDLMSEGSMVWRSWFEKLSVAIDSNYYGGYTECDEPLDVTRNTFDLSEAPDDGDEEEDDATPSE